VLLLRTVFCSQINLKRKLTLQTTKLTNSYIITMSLTYIWARLGSEHKCFGHPVPLLMHAVVPVRLLCTAHMTLILNIKVIKNRVLTWNVCVEFNADVFQVEHVGYHCIASILRTWKFYLPENILCEIWQPVPGKQLSRNWTEKF
jgi:hypothetical protein